MINHLLKIITSATLLFPLLCNADTNIQWQEVNSPLTNEIKIGHGAWVTKQNEALIISSGTTKSNNNVYPETPIEKDSNSAALIVITKDEYSHTQLTEEQGNRSFATTVNYHNATIVIGGVQHNQASNLVNLLVWKAETQSLESYPLPKLPQSNLSTSAVILNDTLFVLIKGETDSDFYSLNLTSFPFLKKQSGKTDSSTNSLKPNSPPVWTKLASLPSTDNQYPYQNDRKLVIQNDGQSEKIFAIGGYLSANRDGYIEGQTKLIDTVWKYNPNHLSISSPWKLQGKIDVNEQVLSQKINTVAPLGQSHILAFTDEGKILSFNAITGSWSTFIQHHVENKLTDETALISQAIVATQEGIYSLNITKSNPHTLSLWQAKLVKTEKNFGLVNMLVLVLYLLCVVLVGLFFVFKNRNTDDYFRGGQSIPWWAAACSIYATMLSSLTYVALPAIVYQTNWLLLIGIWMIIIVAPVAIYIAMPFFRQIDATSAYEYLSKRFNMNVRLFASGLFTLFHIGRMGIVMALTALALSAVTPLSASESVLIMGGLCLIYCTLGGIEAVIWTDTLQTIVLILGALICFITIIMGLDGGLTEFISVGLSDNKFTMVNADFSLESITTLSIWVIVLGGIGQNISSYTADQAVVQRYMVTSDPKEAKKSIWANALLAAPGALLFFCIGTGLYVFYQTHPEKLDPTIQIDQIFPTFIATELPIGIAGLIVAGIFAAAQSTVSTSMNSIATTLVTDFVRPFDLVKTEKAYMNIARWLTFIMGGLGTLAGLIFIDPEIRSLMNAYFKVIGMFMGALGGLFILGALTKKANSTGAIIGILTGVVAMISAWQLGWANGYLYATIGIISCLTVGYLSSLLFQNSEHEKKDLERLTLYTMQASTNKR
ncbi:sodium:solute symporter [Shewanella sp. MBTL60-007]|uniref:sodium:solute symporter n=1 Tax=Shewanella sp. MBTL60-007 TaxID=2815911 RepID=UPI001BB936D6|nr:sodium/solute symporter [Shewanella sp. MBTL60-007]GIU15224.1 sodium:solute symporter [Shewanella sp. MBTL60-007]